MFKKHEEAVEGNFTKKQVAIAKYRLGYDEGANSPTRLHELKEVSEHFKCSISYVTKIMRDVSDFLTEMERDYKKNRVVAAGEIKSGKMKVRHETEGEQEIDLNRRNVSVPVCGIVIDLGEDVLGKQALPGGHNMVVNVMDVERNAYIETITRLYKETTGYRLAQQEIDRRIVSNEKKAAWRFIIAVVSILAGLSVMMLADFRVLEAGKEIVATIASLVFFLVAAYCVGSMLKHYSLAEGMKQARRSLAL